jgi:hypothetical protein
VQFKPVSRAKRYWTGFGAAVVTAEVRFADAATGRVLTIRQFQAAPDSLGRKIAGFSKTERLVGTK